MSEDTTDTTDDDSAPSEATEEVSTEQPSEEEDERPDISEEDRAEMDLSGFAEEVEDSVAEHVDGEGGEDGGTDDADGGDDADSPDTTDDDSAEPDAAEGETWGDMYVEVLAVVLTEAVDELAEEENPDAMTAEEVATLATQPPVNLPHQVDRLAAEMGGAEDLPPGQAVVISTGLLAVVVLAKETDLMGDLIGEVMER